MGSFVTVPFSVDPDLIADTAVEVLRTNVPGWEPHDGSLDVWLIAALSQIAATSTVVAAQVPASVFAQYGTQLIGLAPIQATYASITTTWVASDTLGHTIPAGLQVGYQVSGDTVITFETTVDVVILPGSTTLSGVVLTAVSPGTASNAVPAGPLSPVDTVSWLSSVTATTTSAGGVDAETDTAYLDRLTTELRLMAPRPILPADFAAMAQNVAGVYRCAAINGYDPGHDEVQRVATSGAPTGGTFTLSWGGHTTTAIAFNATAATVQAALVALTGVGSGNVTCTGGPMGTAPVVVEFTGALGLANQATMTASSSLTGGSSPTATVTTVTDGAAPSTGNARMITVVPVDSTGTIVSTGLQSQVKAYLNGYREVNFVVNVTAPTYTTINVAYSVHIMPGYSGLAVEAAVNAALTALLSPANWGGGLTSPPSWDATQNAVRINQVIATIMAVPGVAYASSVTVNSGTTDVTLTGQAPLPQVGTFTATII